VEHLGVRFEPAVNGLAEIEGTHKAMLRAFATRRTEIEARLEQWGATSTRAAEITALDIRGPKLSASYPAGEGQRRCATPGATGLKGSATSQTDCSSSSGATRCRSPTRQQVGGSKLSFSDLKDHFTGVRVRAPRRRARRG
jgi:hypothetical protein